MKLFKKWNDLNQFHEVVKNLNYPRIHAALKARDYKLDYGFKIKLHGTNACVRIEPDGKVVAQKRSSDLGYVEKMDGGYWNDNAGFAQWVATEESYFSSCAKSDRNIYIYGEWCGSGIQSNVACSMTKEKLLWVFAVDIVSEDGTQTRYYDPDLIQTLLGPRCPDRVLVVPWHCRMTIDFLDKAKTQEAIDKLNSIVEKIGQEDPLLKEIFEIEGCGEGLVGYPLLGINEGLYLNDEEYFSWFNFKAKSEAHRVNKTKTATQFDPEKFASTQMFADAYVTEQRLLQAFNEAVNGERNMRLTPDFIKWVVQDIFKESATEREANPDLDWKAISKACSSRAVTWYKSKCQELV